MIRKNKRDAECCGNCKYLVSDDGGFSYCNLDNDYPRYLDYDLIVEWGKSHGVSDYSTCDSFLDEWKEVL